MKIMKNTYVLILMVIVMASSLNAQDIKIGAKAGVNFASVTGDIESVKTKMGFHIGGVAEIPINESFYVQPELLFSSQGYKLDNGTGTLNYLNLPIIGKYYVNDQLSIEAGPQIGYLLSAKIKVDDENLGGGNVDTTTDTIGKASNSKAVSNSTQNADIEQDIKEFFKTTDISFGLGAGYKLDNGLNISARYNFGLSNISKDTNDNVKNSVFMVSVGYFFF